MYTAEAFIPENEDRSYPVWLGNNTLLAILPSFTLGEAGMNLLASYDLTSWFTVADECEMIQLETIQADQSITLDPRIMLPYPYVKIKVAAVAPASGWAIQLSIGDVT
jgi:hypothetical protein